MSGDAGGSGRGSDRSDVAVDVDLGDDDNAGVKGATSGSPLWLHGLLFVAACVTTWNAGGPVFAATLMGILVAQERGHYIVARRYGIDVSLPYFIPLPFAVGTMGAIIRMRSAISRRNALIDVGASGPLAGLAVAIPLLIWGLASSPVGPVANGADGGFIEGNSLLYILLKLIVKGRYLPSGGLDVQISPMAFAAWVGMLVTFINLIPVGQLDGGHVAVAIFGDGWERAARWLHRSLAVVGLGVFLVLTQAARDAGRTGWGAVGYGAQSAVPWLVWATLLFVMRKLAGGRYHPPVGQEPLAPSRRILGIVMAIVFVLLFTPVPRREAL